MKEVELTSANFDEVINGDKPVLVDFWASWCGPCKMMGPVVAQIADERDDIVVGKVNVDDEEDIPRKFGIVSIPTFILFKKGEVVNKTMGAMPKDALLNALGL